MDTTKKRMKFGDAAGLAGVKLIVSETDVAFDAESMVAVPVQPAPSPSIELGQAVIKLYLRHNDEEFQIVGLLKGVEAGVGSLGFLIQALLPIALEGCSRTLDKMMVLQKLVVTPPSDQEELEWVSAQNYLLQNISIREVIGKSAIVGLSFKSPI